MNLHFKLLLAISATPAQGELTRLPGSTLTSFTLSVVVVVVGGYPYHSR